MTIKFRKCKFYCREILLSLRMLLKSDKVSTRSKKSPDMTFFRLPASRGVRRLLWIADGTHMHTHTHTHTSTRTRTRIHMSNGISVSGSEKGVFWKRGLFRNVHFLVILENLEILEIIENAQTVENKGELDHFLEILEIPPVKRPLS